MSTLESLLPEIPDVAPEARDRLRKATYRAQSVEEARESWTYWLYRFYNSDDQLLYVGCTRDVVSRVRVHAASWDNPVSAHLNLYAHRCELEGPIVGHSGARAAERAAIKAEAPLLNKQHNPRRFRKAGRSGYGLVAPIHPLSRAAFPDLTEVALTAERAS